MLSARGWRAAAEVTAPGSTTYVVALCVICAYFMYLTSVENINFARTVSPSCYSYHSCHHTSSLRDQEALLTSL